MGRKILLTGATGLIGSEIIPFLKEKGYEIYAISTKKIDDNLINWVQGDLFDFNFLEKIFKEIKPEYFINFAWITGGDYLTNEKNVSFKNSGEKMLELFYENGGKRAVYSGTCFEYELDNSVLKETSKLNPKTLYAQSKNDLHSFCINYTKEKSLSFAWGRIFYVLGNNEKKSRLTPVIIDKLKNNEIFTLNTPKNIFDYMYSKDIALAFLSILESDYIGDINICTNEGILLEDYCNLIQEILGKKDLIQLNKEQQNPLKIIGDNTILKDVIGFKSKYSIKEALCEIIKSYE